MHKELESWVTLPCHIHLGGALKMIRLQYNKHSSPINQVNDHTKSIRMNIQTSIALKYGMIKHTIK